MPFWDIKFIGKNTTTMRYMAYQNKAWAKLSDALPHIKRIAKMYGAKKFIVYDIVGGFMKGGFIRDKLKVVGTWQLSPTGRYAKVKK